MSNIHFKTSIESIKRSPFQALAAVTVLALTFFIGTFLSILVYSSNKVITYFETRPQVIAFLKDEASPEEISALQRKLNSDIRAKDVKFVSKEEALEIYKKATVDNPLLGELVSPTIFPASLEFSLVDLSIAQDVIDEIKNEPVVENVGFTASLGGEEALGDVVERLRTITMYVRIGGGVLVGALGFTSLLVLMVVIGMRIATRKVEIETLDLIGATGNFIRTPIVIEALIYGLAGVVVGWISAVIIVLYATPAILSYFGEIPVLPRNTLQFFGLLGLILLVEVVFGLIISVGGSLLAISRARRK